MKKFTKAIATAMAMSVLTATLSGCGSKTTNGTTGNNDPNNSGTKKDPVEIVYTAWGDVNEKKATDAVIKKFQEKYTDIKVKPVIIPNGQYDTKITTMVAANEQLDLSMLESATIAYPLAEQGKLSNIKEIINNDKDVTLDTYIPVGYYHLDKDNIIGVGAGIEIFNLFYNKELIQKAGVETPPTNINNAWDWDKFVEVAKKLTIDKNGKNASDPDFDAKKIVQYGVSFGKWWGMWGNYVYSNGGDYITEDGKFGLSSPEAAEAIQRLADLSNVHHVAPTPTAEKGLPGGDIALQTKKVAMLLEGQWMHLPIANSKVDFGVGVLPKMKEVKTQAVTGMYSIFKSSKNQEAAWKLLKYLNDPGVDLTLYNNGNLMPLQKDWLEKPELLDKWATGPARPEGYREAVIGMLLNASVPTPTGTVKNFNKIMDVVNPALDKVWLGEQTAAEALKAAETKAQPLVQGKRER